MATHAIPDTFTTKSGIGGGQRRSRWLKTATTIAQRTLFASAGLLLVLGLIIWMGDDRLVGIHRLVGFVLVLSLWTIAAIAARFRVSLGLVTMAVAWGLVAPALGLLQDQLVTGDWHWTIQVLYLVVAMAMVGWGRLLVISISRHEASRVQVQR